MTRRRKMIWLIATLSLLLSILSVGLVWRVLGSRDAHEVSIDDSVEGLSERGGGAGDPSGGVPEPGVYTYSQSGSERGGIGPFAVTRDLPARARLIVLEADEGGYLLELGLAAEHVEALRQQVADGWIRSTWRRTDITLGGIGRDDRRSLDPPPRWLPLVPRVGLRWRDRFRAGSLSVDATSRIVRRERVEVEGGTLETFVLEVVSDTSGAHPGTRRETIWWSPRLALPVRWRIHSDTRGLTGLRTTTDLRLESPAPSR